MAKTSAPTTYGKKSLTKWVLIYAVLAAVIYGFVYLFVLAKPVGQTTPNTTSTSAQNSVDITNFKYVPATITIKAGESITWTNHDAMQHSATADDKSFDTGLFSQNQTGTLTFSKPGTFTYTCSIHPNMHGTVVVQ